MPYIIPSYVTDPGVRRRIVVECRVMRRLLRECRKAGFIAVRVYDGEEQVKVTTDDSVIETVNSVDDATIHFAPKADRKAWGRLGVYIVLGNDGYDCISDWHCGNEAFDAAIERTTDYALTLDTRA
jgi:hypothetical protein